MLGQVKETEAADIDEEVIEVEGEEEEESKRVFREPSSASIVEKTVNLSGN